MDSFSTRPLDDPAPGYQVTPAALAGAARGVEDVLGELRSLGVGAGRAEAGRGIWALVAGAGPAGHAGLGEAFVTFCSRWEWGVRALVRAGREMAEGLDAASAAYARADRDQGGLFQRILSGGAAPPDRSWAGTGRSVADTWTAVGRDVAGSSLPGMLASARDGDSPVRHQLDDLAGLHGIVE